MDDFLRYDGTVKRDPRIDEWLDVLDPHRQMVRERFERMRSCGADVRELSHSAA